MSYPNALVRVQEKQCSHEPGAKGATRSATTLGQRGLGLLPSPSSLRILARVPAVAPDEDILLQITNSNSKHEVQESFVVHSLSE